MIIHDISLPISEDMVRWPSHPPITIQQQSHLERGDRSTVSIINMCVHTGTHVDAPNHFIAKSDGVDRLDLNGLVGSATVADLSGTDRIDSEVLTQLDLPVDTQRLILKTGNSKRWAQGPVVFFEDYAGITTDGADWLVNKGIRLVGIDALSVAVYDQLTATHETLLESGMIIVEGLFLDGISPGQYQFVCLPVNLKGIDGAPARAVLIEAENR